MDLKRANAKLRHFNNINYNKYFMIRTKSKDFYNTGINTNSQKCSYLNNKMNLNNNLKSNYLKYSSINNEDINYIPPPSLKDRILSPGDDDISPPKSSGRMQDNNQDDDICFYKIKSIYKNKKKLLILDLDETLVHTSFQPLGKDINNRIIKPDIFLKILFDKRFYDLYVLTRPYIYEFLKEMSKIFIIYIFTASIREYANPLLDELDKDKIIEKRLFRDSCVLSNDGKYVKNLNNLNYNLKDIILLDNNPISYSFNRENGIPIKTWHNDKNDKELLKIRNFLNFLSSVDDVRYYIPKVIENDEIIYYKINIILTQQINSNNKEDINYYRKEKKVRINSHFNNSTNNLSPYRKINFNKDENIYIDEYTKTDGNENNNYNKIRLINYREQKSCNFFSEKNKNDLSNIKNKEKKLSGITKSRFNNNMIMNSINFNLDTSKLVKKHKTFTMINKNDEFENNSNFSEKNKENKENKIDNKNNNGNSSFNNLLLNKINKNKNDFQKHRFSSNNLIINNKLNKTDNKNDENIDYCNINTTNNNYNILNCYSYNRKKDLNQANNNSKKKNRIIFVNNNYYNLNLNLEDNNNKNSNGKMNMIKVNKNKKIVKEKFKNLKAHINNGNKNIKRNDTFKESKTFYENKDDDIILHTENLKNYVHQKFEENGKEKYSIVSFFKQKFLANKEPIKLKVLIKEKINKPETLKNKNMNPINKINSEHLINKNSNFYSKRRKCLVKERSCTEFIGGGLNFYKNYLIENENFLNNGKLKKSFDFDSQKKNNYQYSDINLIPFNLKG